MHAAKHYAISIISYCCARSDPLVRGAKATTGGGEAIHGSTGVETGDAAVAATGVATGVEWVEYWDESAGASYFFNTVTQVRRRGGRANVGRSVADNVLVRPFATTL